MTLWRLVPRLAASVPRGQMGGLRDSLSRVRVFSGHGVTRTDGSGRVDIISFSELTAKAGFPCSQENCCLVATNGDYGAYGGLMCGWSDSTRMGVATNVSSGLIRLTWVVICIRI